MFRAVFRRAIWAAATCALLVSMDGCKQAVRPASENRQPSLPAPDVAGTLRADRRARPGHRRGIARSAGDAAPEFFESESAAGDEQVLSAKGFVKVADGYYAGVDAESHAWLHKQRQAKPARTKCIFYTVPTRRKDAGAVAARRLLRQVQIAVRREFPRSDADERDELGASGVRIGTVIGGSPAADANLRVGRHRAQDRRRSDRRTRSDFEKILRKHMGKRVTLTISRNGTVGDAAGPPRRARERVQQADS